MSTIYTAGPIVEVDWEQVDFIHCTLEAPYKGGGLRFRLGTSQALLNTDFDASHPKNGPPYWPGKPIMYPEDAPAVAGKSPSWVMPASISAKTVMRRQQGQMLPGPDGSRHAGFVAFGFFMAPLEEDPSVVGFTMTSERSRVASFWAGFKFPPDKENKGRPQPQMSRIAAPDVPDVTVRPLSKSMQPLKVDGVEVAIRVREYWNFNDPSQYEIADLPQLPAQDEVAAALHGLTDDERKYLIAMVRKGAAGGK